MLDVYTDAWVFLLLILDRPLFFFLGCARFLSYIARGPDLILFLEYPLFLFLGHTKRVCRGRKDLG